MSTPNRSSSTSTAAAPRIQHATFEIRRSRESSPIGLTTFETVATVERGRTGRAAVRRTETSWGRPGRTVIGGPAEALREIAER
jgi:hypothetical protein